MGEIVNMYICNTYNFGNRFRFGITFELPQDPKEYGGSRLWGSICYWVFGQCIGDMKHGVSLSSDVWIELDSINSEVSFSCSEDIFLASAEQILQTMDMDMENEADGIVKDNCFGFVGTFDFWKRFWVSLELDVMQEYLILHFEHDTQSRLIIAKLDKKKEQWKFQSEHMLNAGELKAVFQESFEWICEQYQKEIA